MSSEKKENKLIILTLTHQGLVNGFSLLNYFGLNSDGAVKKTK